MLEWPFRGSPRQAAARLLLRKQKRRRSSRWYTRSEDSRKPMRSWATRASDSDAARPASAALPARNMCARLVPAATIHRHSRWRGRWREKGRGSLQSGGG